MGRAPDPIIEVVGLHKRYGTTVAAQDVSFAVSEGEIFGLLGPNGAGKTTTVEAIAGLRVPDAGTIRVLGLDPIVDHAALSERVGVQLQESALPAKLKVGEAISLYRSFYSHPEDPDPLLETLGLSDKRRDHFRDLSGGQKQRLSIALALIGRPKIAVLDELTTGLDPQARRNTWTLIEGIRDRGVTIVLVTHAMEEAEYLCDRVALIDAGRVVALDTPRRLAGRSDGGERVVFRPSVPFDERLLTDLPGVGGLEHRGDRVVVTGSTDLVGAVIGVLAKAGVTAHDVHLESGTLEDAFLALTGRTFVEPTEPEPTRARERRRGWGPGGTGTLAFALRRRSQGHRAPRSAFRELVRSEWRLTMRSPVGLVWGVGLPILLLVIFGSIPKLSEPAKNLGGLSFFEVYLPTLIALSLSLLALLSLPIPLASYREGRVLRRMATTPVSPSLVLGAQVAVNLVLLVAALLVIVVAGSLAFGAHAPRQVGGFVLSLVLAVLAMFALGVWVASVARSARAAGAVGGALFYPLAFFAGLWVPVQLMAGPLRVIARLTPLGAAVQGMLDATEGHFPSPEPLLVMAAWAAVFGVASVRLFRWD